MEDFKITTKYGVFYIENEVGREEEDRIKLYDSLGRYLDYFTFECIDETWGGYPQFLEEITRKALAIDNVEDFLDWLGIDICAISKNWEDLIKDIYPNASRKNSKEWYDESEGIITMQTILNNEWVNVIGDNYILVYEY